MSERSADERAISETAGGAGLSGVSDRRAVHDRVRIQLRAIAESIWDRAVMDVRAGSLEDLRACTRLADALHAVREGANGDRVRVLAGKPALRSTPERAGGSPAALRRPTVTTVGVFVNEPVETPCATDGASRCGWCSCTATRRRPIRNFIDQPASRAVTLDTDGRRRANDVAVIRRCCSIRSDPVAGVAARAAGGLVARGRDRGEARRSC